MAPDIK